MIGIYKITSPTGKIYIGQSVNIENRISKYRTETCKEQPKLYRSLLKYGFKNHKFEIICECNICDLNDKERFYQDLYDCIGKNGLNCMLTKAKDRSGKSSLETKMKISINNTRPFLGKKHSLESRIKMSNSLKGKQVRLGAILSEETKDKIRQKAIGRKHSDEAKLKMSNARRGKDYSRLHCNNKKIILNLSTGVFYIGLLEASIYCNINIHTLKRKLNGTFKNNTNLIYC